MNVARLSMVQLQTRRGAGLGNEVITWGKAFIGAQELGLRCVGPPWALNSRGYRRDFSSPRTDWIAQAVTKACLPNIRVDHALLEGTDNYTTVMQNMRHEVPDRGPVVVRHTSGMSGGFLAIRDARDYLLAQLLRPSHVANDLYNLRRRTEPTRISIAVHVRLGDFTDATPTPGVFNRRIPLEWYDAVVDLLRVELGANTQVLAFTDSPDDPQLAKSLRHWGAIELPMRSRPLLSDVIAMATSDVLVCSVSSLSMLAAFLSDRPYVWFGPQLTSVDGWLGIWGYDPTQGNSALLKNIALNETNSHSLITRGAAAFESGEISEDFIDTVRRSFLLRQSSTDIIRYGALRAPNVGDQP